MQAEKTILIVDDDPDCSSLLDKVVSHYGYKTHIAGTGKLALDFIEKKECDGVFLDISLPDMGGIEVARHIRDKKGAALPIIALTGYSAEVLEEMHPQALHLFSEVCEKPFDIQAIGRILTKYFQKN